MTVDDAILSRRALGFQRCEWCAYDLATDSGERGCHYYECPYLPTELDVWCPTCRFNFLTEDGSPECGDPPSCEFARGEAPQRVQTLKAWLALQP